MNHPQGDNLLACLQAVLALGIALVGLAVMVRGVGVIGWLLKVLLRGLLVLVVLGAIYVAASQKLNEWWRGHGEAPASVQFPQGEDDRDYNH